MSETTARARRAKRCMEASFSWTLPPAAIRYHGTAYFKCNLRSAANMDTDVLIVGGGPTGLMLANQLGRRGIHAMIVDRHSGPAQQTRAMAVQARTLEIYSRLGIAERALELGRRGTAANMWSEGKWVARIPLGDIGKSLSPFPFVLMLGQDDNERIMGDHLRNWGMAVQWNTELTGIRQEPGHVTATLKQPDGSTREVQAAYVAGCDGGHSAVRELCGITFPGAAYEHVFFVADTEATGPMVAEELNVYLWREGFHLFFPMRGKDRWRVIGILPKKLQARGDVTFEELSPDIRREAGANLDFKECSWFSIYRIHHRAAEKFRDRRCFLLGDAAHVHSPMGGQGMNTGLQDAYNLAWKLALVVSDSWLAGLFRTRILARIAAFAMTFERPKQLAFRTLSQTGIAYRESPLSKSLPGLPGGAPRAGDRFPWLRLRFQANGPVEDLFQKLDDARYNLIVIGQPALPGEALGPGDLLSTHVIPDDAHNAQELARVRIPGQAFYLLRPDGHVGLAGTRLEPGAVTRYLSESRIRTTGPPRSRG